MGGSTKNLKNHLLVFISLLRQRTANLLLPLRLLLLGLSVHKIIIHLLVEFLNGFPDSITRTTTAATKTSEPRGMSVAIASVVVIVVVGPVFPATSTARARMSYSATRIAPADCRLAATGALTTALGWDVAVNVRWCGTAGRVAAGISLWRVGIAAGVVAGS